ncbi:ABC transporter permease subunit [Sansalvadorimonas sp. 2012CJ34-2]|uniref:ABC transporter permease subunit n=1 Tax=Parendozoicomonas callyspongiae TaxID=2942213 RepID=A0ABT0PAL5_9GAMM|nr:ABC transporter permease subunit [Sansalvadorimonas sp. 2012CJ34-2]MCL6268394.1 ABC transporter permease subunit [Sansalvadorimonas sp. 2012CJ34-2]
MSQQISSSSTPDISFDTPALLRYRNVRKLKDRAARYGIATGGLGVIVAITLIFFYLLFEVVPLFRSADVHKQVAYSLPVTAGESLYLAMEEQAEIGLQVSSSGEAKFFDTQDGSLRLQSQLPVPAGVTVSAFAESAPGSNLLIAGLSNGSAIIFKHDYKITWPNDQRLITPFIEYPYGEEPITVSEGFPLDEVAIRDSEEVLTIAGSSGGQLFMTRLNKEVDFLTEEITLTREQVTMPMIGGKVRRLLLDPDRKWLFALSGNDDLSVLDIKSLVPYVKRVVPLAEDSHTVTSLEFLLGGISLLAGDSDGNISQWFMVRNQSGKEDLTRIRSFKQGDAVITSIIPEHRRKGFLALDSAGVLGLYSTTANRQVLTTKIADQNVAFTGIAPRANGLLVRTGDDMAFWSVENEHPEVSWSALWDEVWYESYGEPEYIWQSSASNNDFEPKLSLMPLAFGTLKAAFYAMLLATPLAICGAIYTAYFMAPGMRRKVKPVIELMEALPTVILGFLAGLWLAPYVENNLPGIFSLLILLPFGVLLFAWFWDRLPLSIRGRVGEGWQAAMLVPVILIFGWLAMSLSGAMESLFFGGDMRSWITHDLGIPYDQRNALVVGLAMGFAVIPTIFSIAEDAIFSVPKHLSYGSLALGATPWQTLTKVVLLTASPGIFSAVMIGMGRAVGETMIVLMATGNTPIMDANIFEGMRTLAANIAVEMPESEVGSSHYRILFLAALVLFLFTFVVNTLAEMVRHRLRQKYSSL